MLPASVDEFWLDMRVPKSVANAKYGFGGAKSIVGTCHDRSERF